MADAWHVGPDFILKSNVKFPKVVKRADKRKPLDLSLRQII